MNEALKTSMSDTDSEPSPAKKAKITETLKAAETAANAGNAE